MPAGNCVPAQPISKARSYGSRFLFAGLSWPMQAGKIDLQRFMAGGVSREELDFKILFAPGSDGCRSAGEWFIGAG
ncbi:MAG: hypothetical protein CMO10_00495 [Thalassospira sp.]|nr:hypothetical protein [Thalassospira sp.]